MKLNKYFYYIFLILTFTFLPNCKSTEIISVKDGKDFSDFIEETEKKISESEKKYKFSDEINLESYPTKKFIEKKLFEKTFDNLKLCNQEIKNQNVVLIKLQMENSKLRESNKTLEEKLKFWSKFEIFLGSSIFIFFVGVILYFCKALILTRFKL